MNVLFIYTLQKSIMADKPLVGQECIQFGISYISSVLKQDGHKTDLLVLDRRNKQVNQKMLFKKMQLFNPRIICFTAVHTEFEFVCFLARFIKQYFPAVILMCGGVHVSLNPKDEFLTIFDCICIGEGEQAVTEYVNALAEDGNVKEIENLWIKENGIIYRNKVRPFISNLDSLPFPDRLMWQQWILDTQTRITVLLGRGCPFNCTYCCNHKFRNIAPGEYVRLRSPENILSEIQQLNIDFPGITDYFLEVETIGINLDWLNQLCNLLHEFNCKLKQPIRFSTNLRIFPSMKVDEVFRLLRYGGFESVIIGIESGNKRIRNEVLNRKYSNEDILKAVALARQNHIKIGVFNMIGIPTETLADFQDTLLLNQQIQPDWHSTSIFFPYYGTALYELTKKLNLLPEKLITVHERQKAILDLPGFSAKQIQWQFDSFHYNVYKKSSNKNYIKLMVYLLMSYIGHNRMANFKNYVIKIMYQIRLTQLLKRSGLLGIFQKL